MDLGQALTRCAPLRAGRNGYQRWLVQCTPHFLFFFQKKKRKRAVHGPKEKKKYGDATGARLNERRSQNDFPRAIRLSGGCPSPNGPAPLFAAAPRWLRENRVYRTSFSMRTR